MPDTLSPPADPAEIGRLIEGHQRFAVLAHVRPDGDAIGSQLALGLALREAGKEVLMINEDGVPEGLSFLEGGGMIQRPGEVDPSSAAAVEVVFALDTANRDRLGEGAIALLPAGAIWINIDHHISNTGYGDLIHIDTAASAAGEILHRLLPLWGLPVGKACREALFVAISTDTGSFRYPNATAATFAAISDLVAGGAEVGHLSQELYASYPLRRLRLTQELFKTLRLDHDGRVASWVLTREVAEEIGAGPSDAEGLIDTLRGIDVVEVALYFEATPDGEVKLSTRSKEGGPDVCALCAAFGGGGHRLAAGARLAGPVDEARERVIKQIADTIYGNT